MSEYGAAHHESAHDAHDAHDEHSHADPDDDEAAEIVNVPKGTPIGRRAHPAPTSDQDHPPA